MKGLKKLYKAKKELAILHLQSGITSHKLSLTIVLGLSVGLVPVIGISTAICFVLAYFFRLNHVIIQAVQFSVFPGQVFLIVPFYQAGHYMFGTGVAFFSKENIRNIFVHAFTETSLKFFTDTLYALAAWIIILTVPALVLYFLLFRVFRRYPVERP